MKNKTYDGYAFGELGYPEMLENLLPLIQPGQTALDLGIGTGHMCSPIAFAGLSITGVDNNRQRLSYCLDAFAEAGLGQQITTVDSDALEYVRANCVNYDLVILSDFLMFLTKTDGKEILRFAYNALHPNGYLWITTMSTSDSFYASMSQSQDPIDAETFMAYSHCAGSNPMCFYFPMEIEKYLESMGAKIVFQAEAPNSSDGMFNIVLAQKPG